MENPNNTPSLKVFLMLIGAIVIFFASIIGVNEYTLQTGQTLRLETRPVDPRDLLRGDYVILRYEFESSKILEDYIRSNNIADGTTLYVVFEQDTSGLGQVKYISESRPQAGIFLQVTTRTQSWGFTGIESGISKYFVPEGTGREIEKVRGDMDVEIKVDSYGSARITDLYYQGEKIIPKTFVAPID